MKEPDQRMGRLAHGCSVPHTEPLSWWKPGHQAILAPTRMRLTSSYLGSVVALGNEFRCKPGPAFSSCPTLTPKFFRDLAKMGRGMVRTGDRTILGRDPFVRINLPDCMAR